jgi:hypothetical protein
MKAGGIVTRIEKQTIPTPPYQRRLVVTELRALSSGNSFSAFSSCSLMIQKSMSSTKKTTPLPQIQKIGSHLPILRPSENKQAG